ncbi:unnamed protein product, partial [Rotaria socialis]
MDYPPSLGDPNSHQTDHYASPTSLPPSVTPKSAAARDDTHTNTSN